MFKDIVLAAIVAFVIHTGMTTPAMAFKAGDIAKVGGYCTNKQFVLDLSRIAADSTIDQRERQEHVNASMKKALENGVCFSFHGRLAPAPINKILAEFTDFQNNRMQLIEIKYTDPQGKDHFAYAFVTLGKAGLQASNF
jgi:hypothetical protein